MRRIELGATGLARPVRVAAVIFDTDGVVTDTATVHAAAWKALFDDFLSTRPEAAAEDHRPFSQDDYLQFVDGKPRFDGVASFLESRGIHLPWGDPDDDGERHGHGATVCALGNAKNRHFQEALDRDGVQPFPSTVALARELRAAGAATAVVSASENCAAVLERAGVATLFDLRVDGLDARALELPGKPDPAIYLEAARRLGVDAADAAVVEDAIAGVEAGQRGGFGLVVGVDRVGARAALLAHGADVVVSDLAEVTVLPGERPAPAPPRPAGPRAGAT